MESNDLSVLEIKESRGKGADECAWTCVMMMSALRENSLVGSYIIGCLDLLARINDLDFLQCCESAWLEIKDRKGRMVAGGAFVKE
jgi:hypothetical protein